MRSGTRMIAVILCLMLLLTGCEISFESIGLGKLDAMFGDDAIICSVTAIEQDLLTVEVLSADNYYDAGDILLVDCSAIGGASGLRVGDTITFTYDYITGVIVRGDSPYILVDSIGATEYVPPETGETATE